MTPLTSRGQHARTRARAHTHARTQAHVFDSHTHNKLLGDLEILPCSVFVLAVLEVPSLSLPDLNGVSNTHTLEQLSNIKTHIAGIAASFRQGPMQFGSVSSIFLVSSVHFINVGPLLSIEPFVFLGHSRPKP